MTTYSIREAAELAGVSQRWLRGRVDRNALRAVKGDDGRRRIPLSELVRAGLVGEDGSPRLTAAGDNGQRQERAAIGLLPLLERLEAQAGELATLRLLEAQAGEREAAERQAREATEAALQEARAEAAQLRSELEASREESLASAQVPTRASWWRRIVGASAPTAQAEK